MHDNYPRASGQPQMAAACWLSTQSLMAWPKKALGFGMRINEEFRWNVLTCGSGTSSEERRVME